MPGRLAKRTERRGEAPPCHGFSPFAHQSLVDRFRFSAPLARRQCHAGTCSGSTVRWLRPAARGVAAVTPPSAVARPRGARASMGLEELKQRIHNFRMPIRNPRLLLAVKMVYLFTPVVLGYGVMQLVIPDPEELKKVMAPPSEAAAALTKHQKDGLRETLEAARARHAQAQDQK